MNEENCSESGVVKRSVFDRFVMWLGRQWRESLAESIWDDMTPLGRLTIWLPIWLLCWLSLPIILPICLISFFLVKIGDKPLSWLGKQFFN